MARPAPPGKRGEWIRVAWLRYHAREITFETLARVIALAGKPHP